MELYKLRDELSQHYSELLDGTYECVDRIVLNGYYSPGYSGGGFRTFWRLLKGSDDTLDKNHLMRMAGRFGRRVRAFCASKDIPLIYSKSGDRKHEHAERHIPKSAEFNGIFYVFVSRFPAVVWDVHEATKHLEKRRTFVNHYWFHIIDKDWGHITVGISSHPPFGLRIIFNGHEWVHHKAMSNKLKITKEGNCFTSFQSANDLDGLCNIADTLCQKGQLQKVCDHWVYRCLWFGLDFEQQRQTGFCYKYSFYQVELSRNFLFHRGTQLDDIYQNIIDLTRRQLDLKRLKTIFGFKRRPRNRKHKQKSFQIRIERPSYDMTVFSINDGKLTVKIYDKGERVLRIEVICHNISEFKCKRAVENFPMILEKLKERLQAFISVLFFSHVSFIDKGEFDQFSQPSKKGRRRVAGIDINKPRCRNVMKAVLALAIKPSGFTSKELASKYVNICQLSEDSYNPRQAAYDLRKLKAKGIVQRKEKSRKYHITSKGIAMIVAIIIIREKIFKPIVAGITKEKIAQSPRKLSKVDQLYIYITEGITDICKLHGLTGVIM
jgi:hypothetical protein